jgi:hypothetical protein
MITYRLRPDGTQVKLDSEAKIIINVVNKDDQKIIGHMINPNYYNMVSADAVNWPELAEADYNASKIEVLTYLSNI